ncbi:MAG: FHA domain-containing protein [Blastocatellia bacterium]
MPENPKPSKKSISPDWLVQGVLTKIGDTFDRLTGRGWKPSSTLATSELIEKLKRLLDSESSENGDRRKYVPHNIKLKMQWDKFSTDSDESLAKLEHELLVAVVDHINDRKYYTYAPISIEVKPDYFTSGVKLFTSFEKFTEDEREVEINVSLPGNKTDDTIAEISVPASATVVVNYVLDGKQLRRDLAVEEGQRLSVGRTKENHLAIDDPSVSKFHASLMLTNEGSIVVADTGSTNGTFISGERIAYGKAVKIEQGKSARFGVVNVSFEILHKPAPAATLPVSAELPKTEKYVVGDFEFSPRAETLPAIETQLEELKTEPPLIQKPEIIEQPGKVEIAAQPGLTEQGFKLDDENVNKEEK